MREGLLGPEHGGHAEVYLPGPVLAAEVSGAGHHAPLVPEDPWTMSTTAPAGEK